VLSSVRSPSACTLDLASTEADRSTRADSTSILSSSIAVGATTSITPSRSPLLANGNIAAETPGESGREKRMLRWALNTVLRRSARNRSEPW
jgi:hypothetical protein